MFPSRSVLFAPLFCFFLCNAICHPVGAKRTLEERMTGDFAMLSNETKGDASA